MLTAAECREKADQNMADAKLADNSRHRRKLLHAAEAWLLLAKTTAGLEALHGRGGGGHVG